MSSSELAAGSPATTPAASFSPMTHSGRWAEAGLLVLSLALGLGGYALTALNRSGSSPAQLLPIAGVVVVITALVHLWVRRTAP